MSARLLIRQLWASASLGLIVCASLRAAPVVEGQPIANSLGMELVWLPAGYWVGKYEVTQEQFTAVMRSNPSRWAGATRPVENVDWMEAIRFCEELTAREKAVGALPEGWVYGLPEEKQWETFVGDARVEDMVHGRWEGMVPKGTMPMGSLGPNQYGLYDVRGNVWEWCSDWWDHKRNEKVVRGGSWDLVRPADLEASYRPVSAAVARNGNIGFRVVLRRI